MLIGSLVLPFYLGFATVFQAGLNRYISRDWDLGSVTLLNSLVLAMVSLGLWLAVRLRPESFPEIFRDRIAGAAGWSAWWIIPGILGFTIVAGIPLALSRIGALQTFVILIGSQIVASMIWDATFEGRPVNSVRVAGAVLAFLSAALVNWKG